jgi:spore coat polysaccharide biosynthesis predicted glycosyltransferase SpsG
VTAARAVAPGRLAVRCDGDDVVGAGHVARCLPLAAAFAERGWEPVFVGAYAGLAAWLLGRSSLPSAEPSPGRCGLGDDEWAAAVVDSYTIAPDDLCAAAALRPIATIGEARRCPTAGVVVDYHVDAPAPGLAGLPSVRVIAGPEYAPLDPNLIAARRPRPEVERVLVTVGGTEGARHVLRTVSELVARRFPDATLLVPPGAEGVPRAEALRGPVALVDVLADIDVAVSAAGVTAYELACAGVPAMVMALVENQRRVARACDAAGIAVGIDGLASDAEAAVQRGLERLADPDVRASLSTAGPLMFDGLGACRAAQEIERRWAAARPARPGADR